jgi:hypothetical protein
MPRIRREIPGRSVLIAVVLMASYAYFYEGGGWNQNVRFDLVRAIIERHTLRIDVYHDNTGDKAEFNGHVYADKAPGASFTAVPAVAAARRAFRAFGVDVYAPATLGTLSYVATVVAAALPAALAALAVFWTSRRLGFDATAGGLAAIVCGLGTPLWAYATLLYGHALAAGCLAAAFFGATTLSGRGDAWRSAISRGWWIGLAAGWAVVTEFPAAPPAALIVAFAAIQARNWDRKPQRRLWLALILGGAAGAIVLLTYNALAFGSPLHLGYSSETAGYEGMHHGIFGVTWPDPRVAVELLVGRYRGLLPLAPVLLAAPVGLWMLIRASASRGAGLVASAIAAYYVLMTSGYAYWDGGWSYGSRHLGPALPFLSLGIAPVWQRARPWVRSIVLAMAIVSVGESLVAVSTTPQPPGISPRDPMREWLWPAFVSGDFPIGWQSVLDYRAPGVPMSELERRGVPRASWNAGQRLFGLQGHASLLPLAVVWLLGCAAWVRIGRRADEQAPTDSPHV